MKKRSLRRSFVLVAKVCVLKQPTAMVSWRYPIYTMDYGYGPHRVILVSEFSCSHRPCMIHAFMAGGVCPFSAVAYFYGYPRHAALIGQSLFTAFTSCLDPSDGLQGRTRVEQGWTWRYKTSSSFTSAAESLPSALRSMFGFSFPSWRSKPQDLEAAKISTSTSKKKALRLDTSLISAPIPRTPISITGFDTVDDSRGYWPPGSSPTSSSPTRVGPSNIAWLRNDDSENEGEGNEEVVVRRLPILYPPLPAVVRLDGEDPAYYPVTRSMSSPTPHTHNNPWDLGRRWNMNCVHNAGSTHSLRLETQTQMYHRPMLSNGSAYSYPLMKPLSPIIEQDYISPSAAFKTIPLPSVSDATHSTLSTVAPAPSLTGSSSSERPSPAHSHPFISRPVNRSISQTSHKSNASTSSSAAAPSSSNLSPLDFRSDSCGLTPTPSAEAILRAKKSCSCSLFPLPALPTITAAGSSEEDDDDRDQLSFVTASDSTPVRPLSAVTVTRGAEPTAEEEVEEEAWTTPRPPVDRPFVICVPPPVAFAESGNSMSMIHSPSPSSAGPGPSPPPPRSPPSASSSFIYRRWEREYPPIVFKVQERKRRRWWTETTPAFWTFWFGFLVCPLALVLWLVGGWGFTFFGEVPPPTEKVVSVWEFYFWKGVDSIWGCCGRRGKRRKEGNESCSGLGSSSLKWSWGRGRSGRPGKQKEKERERETVLSQGSGNTNDPESCLRPPRWVAEKQSSDFRRARLNDPKRSLKGIYFGYPFVPRDPAAVKGDGNGSHTHTHTEFWVYLTKPFDYIYGVKLTEVHGKPEGGRRMFDPWIQRCRYAFCYGLLVACTGLACGTAVLLVYNTRYVRST
ncbi:hypothetical protein E1B28_003323 [Marasmius oreades]|uniref:Uncharacterized protein n=1 Tax=Marasmius oreades TaxID=181124 RepID=A0A9P7RLP7_9AGAR|nr:uncharacterized protein E1B28_003323 [Marasmius oreades]KAG7085782.1 hypothetical protein E1B28_003323 [Marasmius oreades]